MRLCFKTWPLESHQLCIVIGVCGQEPTSKSLKEPCTESKLQSSSNITCHNNVGLQPPSASILDIKSFKRAHGVTVNPKTCLSYQTARALPSNQSKLILPVCLSILRVTQFLCSNKMSLGRSYRHRCAFRLWTQVRRLTRHYGSTTLCSRLSLTDCMKVCSFFLGERESSERAQSKEVTFFLL